MRALNYTTNADLHYLKDSLWADGTLCYWRNNPQYSEKEKQKLEKRMEEMVGRNYKVKAKIK